MTSDRDRHRRRRGAAGEWPPRVATATGTTQQPTERPGGAGIPARRAELTDRARAFARGARAESTWAAYEGKWARFSAWCAEHDEAPLPADPLTVARFLTDLAPHWRPATPTDLAAAIVAGHVLIRPGLRPSSIAGYLAAISVAHQALSPPAIPATPDTSTAANPATSAATAATAEAAAATVAGG